MADFDNLGFQEHEGGDKFASLGFAPHDSDNPPGAEPAKSSSWLDKPIMGYTARGVIKGAADQLPTVGMIAGGAAATPANIVTAGVPVGTLAGAGAGYAGGVKLRDAIENYMDDDGSKKSTSVQGLKDSLLSVPGDVATGASYEAGGKILGKGLEVAADSGPGQAVIGGIKGSAKWAAGKVGKIFADVPEETTARYIENPNNVNSAPSREQISDQIVDMKSTAEDKLAQAQEDLANAKTDAKTNTQGAQDALATKTQAFKEALHGKNLTSMAGDVNDAVSDLKDKVVQGSGDAYKILDNAEGSVQTQPLIKLLQSHIDDLKINGTTPTSTSEQAINEIRAMQQRLSQMGQQKIPGPAATWTISNSVSLPEAKQILQSLDKTVKYQNQVGSFAPETDQAFSSLRHAIDSDVKDQVPAYADKMSEVAGQARLLNTTNKLYGTPQAAIGNLNRIGSQTGQELHAPLLDALGKETGRDLTSPVNEFLGAQKVLKTPSLFQKMVDELPESKQLASTQSESAANQAKAQAILDSAKERTNLFKGISADSVTGKTKALGGANKYGAEAKFGPIDEAYGTDLKKQIQGRNDADHFAKDVTRGSRGTAVGTVIGAGLGHLVAGEAGTFIGGPIGAGIGATADKYAGPMFKSALNVAGDQSAAIANTARGVMQKAPSAVGQVAAGVMPQVQGQKPGQPPGGGMDKWANDGFHNLKGHVNDEDRELLEANKNKMMLDPKMKNLLATASNYEPGSKPLDDIIGHIKKSLGSK